VKAIKEVIQEYGNMNKALIDASSIIYMDKAGFLDVLQDALNLITIPDHESPNADNDRKLIACAKAMNLPVITEDRKIITCLRKENLLYYNALMMLHFLLFKGRIDKRAHSGYFEALKNIAWYSEKVWAYGKAVYDRIVPK